MAIFDIKIMFKYKCCKKKTIWFKYSSGQVLKAIKSKDACP